MSEEIIININMVVNDEGINTLRPILNELKGKSIDINIDEKDSKEEINEFTNIVKTVREDGTIDIRFENNAVNCR